jgi:hypothetical protein
MVKMSRKVGWNTDIEIYLPDGLIPKIGTLISSIHNCQYIQESIGTSGTWNMSTAY